MNRQTYLWNVAAFLIFLVITLPIYSAGAWAATVNSVDAYGAKGISGYRGQKDTTTINATVTATEWASSGTGQVKILEDPTVPFNCTLVNNVSSVYECLRSYPETNLAPTVGVTYFTLQVLGVSGNAISAPFKGSVTVDSKPPKVVSVNYTVGESGAVVAGYNVLDEACSGGTCAGLCTGIDSVKFTVSNLAVGSNTSFDSACSQTGTLNLTGLVVGGTVGKKRICLEATDKMGQSTTECKDVNVDAKAPAITGASLVDINGNVIKYTNGQPVGNVDIKINITEDSGLYHPDTGYAGFIKVNASDMSERSDHQTAFSNMVGKCENATNTTYTCTVSGLYLIMSKDRTITIRVEAKDVNNNILNTTQSLSVTFDKTAPVGTKIYSNFVDADGNYWVREDNNTIMMDISESGSGMGNGYAFLDFVGFGAQKLANKTGTGTVLYPNTCASGWTCYWYNIAVSSALADSGDKLYLKPVGQSRDDAGNTFGSPLPTGTLNVDLDEPEIDDDLRNISNITGIGSTHPQMTNLSSGDALEIHIFVKDHSGIKSAHANFSEVIENGEENAAGNCSENQVLATETEQTIYECYWQTSAIKNGYEDDLAIYFTFEDYTNHTLEYTWDDIEILELENVTTVRWSIIIDEDEGISPSKGIDRLSWSLASHRMYYQLKMGSTSDVVGLVSINFDPLDCYGLDWVNQDKYTSKYSISRAGFADFDYNPTYDMMVIELDPNTVPEYYQTDENGNNVSVDAVYVNCTFTIQSIVSTGSGDRALTLPQDVNVTFPIPVYNNPLGENIGNIKDKIAEEEDYISNAGWQFVKYTDMILSYVREICRFIETLMSLMMMWAGLKELFTNGCNAGGGTWSESLCTISRMFGQSTKSTAAATDGILGSLYYFCGLFISCRISKDAKDAINQQCSGKDSAWCTVKKTWAKVNGFWAEYTGSEWLNRKIAAGEVKIQKPGERESRRELTAFSVDDLDPTRSMFSSIFSGCLPGVMMNLNKLRQIKCKRLLCYKVDVAYGRPVWQCDQQYDYDICTFWTGQAFAAIPIFQWIEQIGNLIMQIVRQPLSFILGMVIDKTCQLILCAEPKAPGCYPCIIAGYATSLAAIITDLAENTGKRFEMAGFDLCEEALKETPSYANIDWPGVDEKSADESGTSGTPVSSNTT